MVQTKRLQMRGEPARTKCRLKSLRESRSATDPGRHGTGLSGWFSEEKAMTETHATPSLRTRVVCALTYVLRKTNRSKNLKAKVPMINALSSERFGMGALIWRNSRPMAQQVTSKA